MENKIIDGIVKFYFIAVSVLMYYFLTEVIDVGLYITYRHAFALLLAGMGIICFLVKPDIGRGTVSAKSAFLYTQRDDSLSKNFNERQFSEIEEVVRFLHSRPCAPRDFDSQIARYSCFMCFALLAQAAESGSCRKLNKIKKLITKSAHMEEIKKAKFKDITVKSRIAVRLMKMKLIYTAFCFLNVCGYIKKIH